MAIPKAKRKRRTERELMMLLSLEDIFPRLMTPEYGGYQRRYRFLKEPLNEVRRQRLILEESMAGNRDAIKQRGMNGNNKPMDE